MDVQEEVLYIFFFFHRESIEIMKGNVSRVGIIYSELRFE